MESQWNFFITSSEKELVPSKVQLRYVDSVSPYILGNTDKFDFLRELPQINAEKFSFIEGNLDDIQFTKSFSIDDESQLNLIISTGVDRTTKEDVIEWLTFIGNKKRLTWDEILSWAHKAQNICSNS